MVKEIILREGAYVEYDKNGSHRIALEGEKGEWASYSMAAKFEKEGNFYISFTDFWRGYLPDELIGVVLKIVPVHNSYILKYTMYEKRKEENYKKILEELVKMF